MYRTVEEQERVERMERDYRAKQLKQVVVELGELADAGYEATHAFQILLLVELRSIGDSIDGIQLEC